MKTMPACLRLSFFGLLVVVCLNGVVYVLLSSFHVPLPNSHRLAEKRLSFDSGRQQGLQRRIRVGGSGGDSGASTEDEYEPYDDVEPEPPPEEEGDDETLGLWSDGVASPTDDGASGWESGNGTAWNESVAGDFNFTLLEELWEKQVVDWAANSSAAESGGSGAQDGSEAGGGKEGEEGNRDDTIFGGGEQVGASTPGSGQGSGGDAAAVAERPPWPPPPPALPERIRANQSSWPIWWFAPFFDHTSFGREAATLVLGVLRGGVLRPDELWTAPTQGSCNYTNDAFMPPEDFELLDSAYRRSSKSTQAIVVCHSLPNFWARPTPTWGACEPCPPFNYTPALSVGRAMAETDRYNSKFVEMCNRMDEIWVPSEFSRKVLQDSGVQGAKLKIVPIPVNTTYFDPATSQPLKLPIGQQVFMRRRRRSNATKVAAAAAQPSGGKSGRGWGAWALAEGSPALHAAGGGGGGGGGGNSDGALARGRRMLSAAAAFWNRQTGAPPGGSSSSATGQQRPLRRLQAAGDGESVLPGAGNGTRAATGGGGGSGSGRPVRFLSVFKWEGRKGWEVLLEAYLQEFNSSEPVELYILTKPFMAAFDDDIRAQVRRWALSALNLTRQHYRALPRLYVISDHLSAADYLSLYRSVDAFVISTRGEGWGMPITEAMSMGLPAIVTNWSGPTAFVDDSVGYPLDYSLVDVPPDQPWWFLGSRWAQPSVSHLRQLMRHVAAHPEEAVVKGAAARRRMVELYSPETVAAQLGREFARLRARVADGDCCSTQWMGRPESSLDGGGEWGDNLDEDALEERVLATEAWAGEIGGEEGGAVDVVAEAEGGEGGDGGSLLWWDDELEWRPAPPPDAPAAFGRRSWRTSDFEGSVGLAGHSPPNAPLPPLASDYLAPGNQSVDDDNGDKK